MKTLNDTARQFAEVTARVIVTAAEIGLPDAPEKLTTQHAIRFLACAHVELRDQIRALHDLVDQADPNDPIRTALAKVGLASRPPNWTPKPRLVPTPAQIGGMTVVQLMTLYQSVMGSTLDFTAHQIFVVRVWDGMDGCWTDCTRNVNREEALRTWASRTDGGARHIAYDEIDYYAIFPGGTHMLWDGSEGMEMQR